MTTVALTGNTFETAVSEAASLTHPDSHVTAQNAPSADPTTAQQSMAQS